MTDYAAWKRRKVIRNERPLVVNHVLTLMAVKRVNHVGYVKCFSSYEIHDGSDLIELDVYHGRLAGLITAEVEFSSKSQCEDFVPPPWFGKELTDDPRYKNKNLALHGLPKT